MCLPGRFLSCLLAVGSMGGILTLACRCFLGVAVSGVFKVGVVGISASTRATSWWKIRSCLGAQQEVHFVYVDLVFQVNAVLVLHGVSLLQLVKVHQVGLGFLLGVLHCLKCTVWVYLWCLS